jgi:elongation factor P
MAIPATQLRPGMIIKHNNDLHLVFSVEHRTPGNLRAFIQAKLRNLRSGAMFEYRFRSGDAIEKITVDEVNMEYLYNDGELYYFMDQETYDQVPLMKEQVEDAILYLRENDMATIKFFKEKAFIVEPPNFVNLKVIETEPGVKGDTATNVTKAATVETGAVIQVPIFIEEGEIIQIDTRTGEYLSRAK